MTKKRFIEIREVVVLSLLLLVLIGLVYILVQSGVFTGLASIFLQPSSKAVTPGSQVQVDIYLSDITDLAGVQLSVEYDPTYFSYLSTSEGNFLSSNGGQTVFLNLINSSKPGLVKDIVILRTRTGASGSGVVASLYFNATRLGLSKINISNAILSFSNGSAVSGLSIINTNVSIVPVESLSIFQEVSFSSGLTTPTSMEFAPDGRLFVTEKSGRVRVILSNGALLPTPFTTLNVLTDGERGLLGVTVDPNFTLNRYVYLYYTTNTNPVRNRLSRFTADATNLNIAQAGSEMVLLDFIPSASGYHNGGAIHFGTDGKLYVAVGEGHNSQDAQSLNTMSGKLLRINSDGSIPSDNPFYDTLVGQNRSIWAYGLRNPFTFAIDPVSGKMHINDVGQNTWEEVNLGVKGANYGWPVCEGYLSAGNPCQGYALPIHAYSHTVGQAITGGTFYRGTQFPAYYAGYYFFADYLGNWIKQMRPVDNVVSNFRTASSPVDLKVGPDGKLYYLSLLNGAVYRIESVSGNRVPIAAISANPSSGLAPLAVSFSGATSSDPDGDSLTYLWDYGDGTFDSRVSSSHTYTLGGNYIVTLTVSDSKGGIDTETTSIAVGSPPTATIISPSSRALFNGGDIISFLGNGTDIQDGLLDASRYIWNIELHHDAHSHPFLGPLYGIKNSTFQTAYRLVESSPNIFYRIHLTVNDSSGLTSSTYVDIIPRTVNLSFRSNVSGVTIDLDGQPFTLPFNVTSVVGYHRSVNAPSPQIIGGREHAFASWSDLGVQNHTIVTPTTNTVYTVNYREVAIPGNYNVNVNKVGSGSGRVSATGINCGVDCSEVYAEGTTISLSATPSTGSVFGGWSGACTGTSVCTISSINSNRTLSANFILSFASGSFYRSIEAETGSIVSPMAISTDTLASNGSFIYTNVANFGTSSYSFSVPSVGNYIMWARVKSPNLNTDSFYVSVDGTEDVWDTAQLIWNNNWQWTRIAGVNANGGSVSEYNLQPRVFNLNSGLHTLVFRGSETNTQLDRILITNNITYIPSDSNMNSAPSVSAGNDQSIQLPFNSVTLSGSVDDDKLPSGTLTTSWSRISGPLGGSATFANSNLLSTTSTFNVAGTYVLRLSASDGVLSSFDDLSVIVNSAANIPPTVIIASPAQGASFFAPANINIIASATDNDGTVARVEFYKDGINILNDTTFPYNVVWNNVAAGTYILTARAIDNGDSVTSSAGVNVIVSEPAPSAPTSLAAVAVSPSQINISWIDSSITETGFNVYRSSSLAGIYTRIAVLPANTLRYNDLTGLSAGTTYYYKVNSNNSAGESSDSNIVSATTLMPNVAPSVTLVSPLPFTNYTFPANVNLTATATDSDGTIAKVEFYNGNTKLGEDTTTVYSLNIGNLVAGNYALKAQAIDNNGLASNSSTINIIIRINEAPRVVAGSNQLLHLPTLSTTLFGTVNDDGLPSKTLVSRWTQVSGPVVATFTNSSNLTTIVSFSMAGTYTLRLSVNDSINTTSNDLTVIINSAPSVNAGSDTSVTMPNSLILDGAVNDDGLPSGTLSYRWTQVSGPAIANFASVVNVDTSVTFTLAGTYVLRLNASDGTLSNFANVRVTVNPVLNVAPTTSITSPAQGASYITPAQINITATATDNDGTITRVEFYNGNTKLGEDTTAPYNYTWNNIGVGTYVLTSRATDNGGLTSTSLPVTVLVNNVVFIDGDGDGVADANDLCPLDSGKNIFGCPLPKMNEFDIVSPNLTLANLSNVRNFAIGKKGVALINYTLTGQNITLLRTLFNRISALDLDSAMAIQPRGISVPSVLVEELNKPVIMTFYNITFGRPIVRNSLRPCTECKINSYDRRTGTLNVFAPNLNGLYDVVDATPIVNNTRFDIMTNVSDHEGIEIPNFEIGISRYGKVVFLENISLFYFFDEVYRQLELDPFVNITRNKIAIQVNDIPMLNKPAFITLYNVSLIYPLILRDGVKCTDCTNISLTNKTLIFRVNGFSEYEAIEDPNIFTSGNQTNTTTNPPSSGNNNGGNNNQNGNNNPPSNAPVVNNNPIVNPNINITNGALNNTNGNGTLPDNSSDKGDEQKIDFIDRLSDKINSLPHSSKVSMMISLIILLTTGIVYVIYLSLSLVRDYQTEEENDG